MAENNTSTSVTIGWLVTFSFIAVKLAGHAFALWSWWWVLLPIIPWLGLLATHAGL